VLGNHITGVKVFSMGHGLALSLHGVEASVHRMSNLRIWGTLPLAITCVTGPELFQFDEAFAQEQWIVPHCFFVSYSPR
jgi:hypothetical protein